MLAALVLSGQFALGGSTAQANATMRTTFTSATQARLDISETALGRTVRAYDVDMTKKLHLIVVSHDLASFQHLHPAETSDGHFKIDVRVPRPGIYDIYADAVPHGMRQQVFRFRLHFGNGTGPDGPSVLVASTRTVRTGPYDVALDSLALNAGKTTMLTARITEGGKPARDLHPYLGGAAHAVFIAAADYSYIHVHPMAGGAGAMSMDMGEMASLPDSSPVEPTMMLHVTAAKPGTYKLWLQFRGGSKLYVAPFVLSAR